MGFAAGSMWPLAIASLGGSALSALTMPEGQELQSFEGEGGLDPRQTLTDAQGSLRDLMQTLGARAGQPINLRSAYTQQPPVFTGGGLPMPIGLTGVDPALSDPSLLSLPGLQLPSTFGSIGVPRTHPGGGVNSNDGYQPHDDAEIYTDRSPVPRDSTMPTDVSGNSGPRRRPVSRASAGAPNVSAYDDMPALDAQGGGAGDDLAQTAGAIELFLRSYASR